MSKTSSNDTADLPALRDCLAYLLADVNATRLNQVAIYLRLALREIDTLIEEDRS